MTNAGEVTLPIAETFHSIQGEGQWVGTPMHFIRLAGCPVGRPAKAVKAEGPLPLLPTGAQAMSCASWDGRQFWCDTDYNTHMIDTPEKLIAATYEKHICLTGGEPLVHGKKLLHLFQLAYANGIEVHIESSGTVALDVDGWRRFWLTIAPKIGCLESMINEADEIKLLVDEHFHPDHLTQGMRLHSNVFLCPINEVETVNQDNVELCMHWLKEFPHWRLSCQVHKFLHLR